jgi:hypothetical protein
LGRSSLSWRLLALLVSVAFVLNVMRLVGMVLAVIIIISGRSERTINFPFLDFVLTFATLYGGFVTQAQDGVLSVTCSSELAEYK